MSNLKRELQLSLSVLMLLVMSSLSGCISDVKPVMHSVLEVAATQQDQFCSGVSDVASPEWQKCKDLAAAVYGAQVALDVKSDDGVLTAVAGVLEGLKSTWHVRCDGVTEGARYGFCSASKTVTNALIEVFSAVNEGASK